MAVSFPSLSICCDSALFSVFRNTYLVCMDRLLYKPEDEEGCPSIFYSEQLSFRSKTCFTLVDLSSMRMLRRVDLQLVPYSMN